MSAPDEEKKIVPYREIDAEIITQQIIPWVEQVPIVITSDTVVTIQVRPRHQQVISETIAEADRLVQGTVRTQDDMDALSAVAQSLKGIVQGINEAREVAKRPIINLAQAIENEAKTFAQPSAQALEKVLAKLHGVREEQRARERAELLERQQNEARLREEARAAEQNADRERERATKLKTPEAQTKARETALLEERRQAALELEAAALAENKQVMVPAFTTPGISERKHWQVRLVDWKALALAGLERLIKVELRLSDAQSHIKFEIDNRRLDPDNPKIPGLEITQDPRQAVRGASPIRRK